MRKCGQNVYVVPYINPVNPKRQRITFFIYMCKETFYFNFKVQFILVDFFTYKIVNSVFFFFFLFEITYTDRIIITSIILFIFFIQTSKFVSIALGFLLRLLSLARFTRYDEIFFFI